jgi:hypothetical protein
MDPTISPSKSTPSYASRSLRAAARGWMSENQFLLAERERYFFLDIPFYRTSPYPRRRRDIYSARCATLTIQLVQNIGQPKLASISLIASLRLAARERVSVVFWGEEWQPDKARERSRGRKEIESRLVISIVYTSQGGATRSEPQIQVVDML